MRRSRFSVERMKEILREQESGATVGEICRRHGISESTFYNWKQRLGNHRTVEARRLKALKEENARLKRLLAEAMLENARLKDHKH